MRRTTQQRTVSDSRTIISPSTNLPPGTRPPVDWSLDECFLRTGTWCCLGLSAQAQNFQHTQYGGSHVQRPLRKYAADHGSCAGADEVCTKNKVGHPSLVAGTVLGWCHDCRKCLFFAVMSNPESPRTVFEILYSLFPKAPARVIYDNACNLHQYCLNRESAYFKQTIFLVDSMHFRDHKQCCIDYNTSKYPDVLNSPLAEQRNSVLRKLENSMSYMSQSTFLLFLRHYLHRLHDPSSVHHHNKKRSTHT